MKNGHFWGRVPLIYGKAQNSDQYYREGENTRTVLTCTCVPKWSKKCDKCVRWCYLQNLATVVPFFLFRPTTLSCGVIRQCPNPSYCIPPPPPPPPPPLQFRARCGVKPAYKFHRSHFEDGRGSTFQDACSTYSRISILRFFTE